MEIIIKRSYKDYKLILLDKLLTIKTTESRTFLASIGINGEVALTLGHSDNSVSLITDSKAVLIGDLYPFLQIMEDYMKSLQSRAKIIEMSGIHVFLSHTNPFELTT